MLLCLGPDGFDIDDPAKQPDMIDEPGPHFQSVLASEIEVGLSGNELPVRGPR